MIIRLSRAQKGLATASLLPAFIAGSMVLTVGIATAQSGRNTARSTGPGLGANYPLTLVSSGHPTIVESGTGVFGAVPTPGPSSTGIPTHIIRSHLTNRELRAIAAAHHYPGRPYTVFPGRTTRDGRSVIAVRKSGSSTRLHRGGEARPKVVRAYASFSPQWTPHDQGGFGDPTDSNVATDGNYIVVAYNGWDKSTNPQHSGQQIFQVTNSQGSELGYVATCGYSGFNACSDPSILYDSNNNVWIFSYLALCNPNLSNAGGCPTQTGDELVMGVSNDANPLDGFDVSTIALTTSGFLDQPRLAVSRTMVVASANELGDPTHCSFGLNNSCARIVVIDLSRFEDRTAFYWGVFQESGHSLVPASSFNFPALTMFESADYGTPRNGDATWWVSGYAQGPMVSEYTFPDGYGGIDQSEAELFANMPVANQLDASDGRFNTATMSGDDQMFALGTQEDTYCKTSTGLAITCMYGVELNYDPATGQPISVNNWINVVSGVNWNLLYPAASQVLSGSAGSRGILGIVDFTCSYSQCGAGQYPGAQGFRLVEGNGGLLTFVGRQSGNVSPTPDGLVSPTSHRWGDYSGCAYIGNSNPSGSVCVSQWADKNDSGSPWQENLEVFANYWPN